MVHVFRKYQQPVMIAVTVLIIVAFVWLYNGTQLDKLGTDKAYRVYDRTLSQADVERAARRFQLARALDLGDLVYGLTGNALTQDQAIENFVWNSFVLAHESRELGIAPTSSEVLDVIKNLPAFQTNNQYDPVKYQEFLQNLLMPNGFTDSQLEELVRDDLRLKKLIALVGSTVDVTPAEFRNLYTETHQKTDVSLVRFNLADFASAIAPTDEEIQKYFEEHKATLTTDEKRVVSFVKIDLTEAEKALSGKERVEALQRLSDRANDFGQALLEKGTTFAEAAKTFNLEVKTTPEFNEANPAPDLAAVPQATGIAFHLTESEPTSEAIQFETGFYLMHLEKVIPKRPLTLEEARPRIVEAIKNERGHNALVSKANEVRAKIAEALKAGKPFADAAAEAGVKVEPFPAFSIAEPAKDNPLGPEVAEKAIEVPVGGLSEFAATSDGGLLIYVNKREPVDEAKLVQDMESQIDGLRSFKRVAAFREWLQLRRKDANIHSLRVVEENPAG